MEPLLSSSSPESIVIKCQGCVVSQRPSGPTLWFYTWGSWGPETGSEVLGSTPGTRVFRPADFPWDKLAFPTLSAWHPAQFRWQPPRLRPHCIGYRQSPPQDLHQDTRLPCTSDKLVIGLEILTTPSVLIISQSSRSSPPSISMGSLCRFNQGRIRNIWGKESRKSQKAKLESAVLKTINLMFTLYLQVLI